MGRCVRAVALSLALLAGAAPPAAAVRGVRAETFHLGADETLEDERAILALQIDVDGTARDDLFLFGSALRLGGRFERALWALGDTVTLTGHVGAHARLGGRTVSIENAEIGAGALLLGGTVRIDDTSRLHGNVRIAAEDAIVRGRVGGALRVEARRARLGGQFDGDVTVDADDLAVLPGTRIAGNLTARVPAPFVLDPRVTVEGETLIGRPVEEAPRGPNLGFRFALLLAAYLSFLPWLALFPRFAGRAARRLRTAPWRCALAGLIALGLVPLAAMLTAASVVGLPLALTLAAGYGLLLWFAPAVPALAAGHLLLRGEGTLRPLRALATLALGLTLIHLLALVPRIGGGLVLLVLIFGQGALLLALRESEPPPPPPNPQPGSEGAPGEPVA